jgi:hypothetical protein
LRNDIGREIFGYSGILVTTNETIVEVRAANGGNSDICPDNNKIENMIMGTPSKTQFDMDFDKLATRTWTQIKLNDF